MKTKTGWLLALLAAGAFILAAVSPLTRTAAQIGTGDNPVYLPILVKPADPNDPGDPPPDSYSGRLEPGGSYETPDGVGVGALADTLTAPITLTITGMPAPALALPPAAQARGHFFEIKADQEALPAPESPFIVGFPVPAGANTNNLALAALGSGEGLLETDPAAQAWVFLEGFYDAAEGHFLTTLSSLETGGRTFVLVEHPDFDSPGNTNAANRTASPTAPQIRVRCVNFTIASQCTSVLEHDVSVYLGQYYDRVHSDLGFREPRLRNLIETLDFNPLSLASLGYSAYIEPHNYGFCASRQAGGYYYPPEARLVLCLDPAVGLNEDYIHILLHEYFHATQYAYPAVLFGWHGLNDAWVIEGMAKTVEESFFVDEMLRSEIGGWVELHDVDNTIEVEDTLNEYFAQDFWVYHGQKQGLGMEYLKDFLLLGATTETVATQLGDGQFMTGYWEWVKNQALEKTQNFDGALGPACSLLAEVAPLRELFNFVWLTHMSQEVLAVEPLSSVVVEIRFDHDYDVAFGVAYALDSLPGASQSLKYKFYKEGEGGCESVPDGSRTYYDVTPGDTYYALVTNTDISNTHDYMVSFVEVGPIP